METPDHLHPLRFRSGIYDKEDTYICRECGWTGEYSDLRKFGDNIYCPECRMIDPEIM